MEGAAQYWNRRAKKNKHTGWADPVIYFYDQALRLRVIEELCAGKRFRSVLDYGCGIGDFSVLLSKFSDAVLAVDLSSDVIDIAKVSNSAPNVRYEVLEDGYPNVKRGGYDLVLAITVFQHILKDQDFVRCLKDLKLSLADGGRLILVDSFSDSNQSSEYLKFRALDHFLELCAYVGFVVDELFDFYHPVSSPTPCYLEYKSSICVKFVGRMVRFRMPFAAWMLKALAKRYSAVDSGFVNASSMSKLIILR